MKVKYDSLIVSEEHSRCGGCIGHLKGKFDVGEWVDPTSKCTYDHCRTFSVRPINEHEAQASIVVGDVEVAFGFIEQQENDGPFIFRKAERTTEKSEARPLEELMNLQYEVKLVL